MDKNIKQWSRKIDTVNEKRWHDWEDQYCKIKSGSLEAILEEMNHYQDLSEVQREKA